MRYISDDANPGLYLPPHFPQPLLVLMLNNLESWEKSKLLFPVLQIRKQRLKKMKQHFWYCTCLCRTKTRVQVFLGSIVAPITLSSHGTSPAIGGDEPSQSDDGLIAVPVICGSLDKACPKDTLLGQGLGPRCSVRDSLSRPYFLFSTIKIPAYFVRLSSGKRSTILN